jgi:general stress protein 26
MNSQEVKDFTKNVNCGMLATSDGRKVGVRPMSGLAWNQNQLWCATITSTDNAEKLWLYNAVPALKDYIPAPSASDYVVIKMSPDNIRVTNPDFTYQQVELK